MEQEVNTMTAAGLVFTLALGLLLLVLPRRYALIPLLIGGCYMTLGQALVIGGLHFYLIRILIFFGIIRVFVREEIFSIEVKSVDKILLTWLLISSFLYVLLGETSVAITERLGAVYDTLGVYLLARSLIRDLDDIVLAVKTLGIIIIPLAVLFAIEHTTGKNLFSILGGVPELSEIRNGRVRCQGPFRHSILAGTFGATAMPLFVGLSFYSVRNRVLAGGAFLAATIIVIASASSGPLLAYLTGVMGLFFWFLKSNMRTIRWGLAALLLTLNLYMEAPIWFLIGRISDVAGGGGWYRSALSDAAIRNIGEWWLIGTAYTAHWMPTGLEIDPNSADMVNYFVAQGVKGGLLSVTLFIWLITKCFKTIGLAVRNENGLSSPQQFMIWCRSEEHTSE